jgi:uncharacterized DUF497 family protein
MGRRRARGRRADREPLSSYDVERPKNQRKMYRSYSVSCWLRWRRGVIARSEATRQSRDRRADRGEGFPGTGDALWPPGSPRRRCAAPRDDGAARARWDGRRPVDFDQGEALVDKQVYKTIYARMPKFDWDEGNRKKCAARVPIEEIEAVLSDPETIVTPQFSLSASDDPDGEEQRYRATGKNREGRGVFVVFTTRIAGEDLALRPISVHYISRSRK